MSETSSPDLREGSVGRASSLTHHGRLFSLYCIYLPTIFPHGDYCVIYFPYEHDLMMLR